MLKRKPIHILIKVNKNFQLNFQFNIHLEVMWQVIFTKKMVIIVISTYTCFQNLLIPSLRDRNYFPWAWHLVVFCDTLDKDYRRDTLWILRVGPCKAVWFLPSWDTHTWKPATMLQRSLWSSLLATSVAMSREEMRCPCQPLSKLQILEQNVLRLF